MELQETIEAAVGTAEHTVNRLRAAFAIAWEINRPEGRNVADKAMTEHLSNLLEQASKLESALKQIS